MQLRNIREVTNTKYTNKLTAVRTFQDDECLIYQRVLGHKPDMPGSAQWVETSVHTSPAEYLNDWINEKASYSLVFWSKNFAREC